MNATGHGHHEWDGSDPNEGLFASQMLIPLPRFSLLPHVKGCGRLGSVLDKTLVQWLC